MGDVVGPVGSASIPNKSVIESKISSIPSSTLGGRGRLSTTVSTPVITVSPAAIVAVFKVLLTDSVPASNAVITASRGLSSITLETVLPADDTIFSTVSCTSETASLAALVAVSKVSLIRSNGLLCNNRSLRVSN